jgi:hypothetical protein
MKFNYFSMLFNILPLGKLQSFCKRLRRMY